LQNLTIFPRSLEYG